MEKKLDENYFEIGKIVNTQGIKGDVRILPSTDDIKRFELLKTFNLFRKNERKTLTVEKIWYHKKFVIVKFQEINSMNEAELLKDFIIRISDDESIPLSQDEYFIRDLIGVNVYDDEDILLGKIKDVLVTGANDVYIIANEKADILIPAIKQCILSVDMENKKMVVKLLKGLVE